MAELITRHPVLSGLPESAIAEVAGCARNTAFPSGTLLIVEGEPADTWYLIRRGQVAIELHAPGRGALVIDTLGPGAVVGWSWLVPPYRWHFDARAIGPVGAVAIDGACLRAKSDADPALGYALMSRVSAVLLERLLATQVRLLDLYGTDGAR